MKEAREYLQESFASYTARRQVEREMPLSPDVLSRIVLSEGETEEVRKGSLLQLFYQVYGQRGEEAKAVLKEVLGARIPHALKQFAAGVLCDRATAEPPDQMTDRAADRTVDLLVSLILRGSLLYRKELLIALGRTASPGNAKVTELLRRFLRYGDQHTKHAAARAAGLFGNEGLVPDLVYCLQKETNETVLLPATEALGRLRSPASRTALEHVAETFPSETVRQKAREALQALDR